MKKQLLVLFTAVFALASGFAQPDNMVRIDGGTFSMGSPTSEAGRNDNDAARQDLSEKQNRKTRFFSDQDRIRQNLNAAGSSSDLGKEYMKRMTALDGDIDRINAEIENAEKLVQSAKAALDTYIANLKL